VQELCERVAIVAAGRISYEGSLADLLARAGRRYRLTADDRSRARAICAATLGIADLSVSGEQIEFAVDGDDALLRLAHALSSEDIVIQALVPEQLTLERVFFELTERARPEESVVA
jgi:ABC-type multidrug transport system ATPase subunit